MGAKEEQIRVLFLGDLVGTGLDGRLCRTAVMLANLVDITLGTWGGEAEPGLIAEVNRSGIRVHNFRFPIQMNGSPICSIREVAGMLDAEGIEVVHCQCYRHLVLCRLASALSRSKPEIVFTDHNPLGWRGIKAIPRLGLLGAMRPRVVDLSNHLSRIPILRRRAVWIPNGVDTSFFRGVDRPSKMSGVVSLIYPARLDPVQKRHSEFLGLCSVLKRRGYQFRLILAGDGPARKDLETLVSRLKLHDVVIFAGQLSRDQILRELLAADIGVFPSYSEMLPVAVLEMMATGLPVVAYAAGGTPLIIRHGETGFVAPIGAVDQFGEYLVGLMTNPTLARDIGRRAASDVKARFDVKVIAHELLGVYQGCALGSSPYRHLGTSPAR
jgi:glycosyltransferase involved in cell wall biosynthesis